LVFEKFYGILRVEMVVYLSHIQFLRYIKIVKVLTRNCPAGCGPVTNPRTSEQHNASAQGPAGCRFSFSFNRAGSPTPLAHLSSPSSGCIHLDFSVEPNHTGKISPDSA
jgi:hypothetical protein